MLLRHPFQWLTPSGQFRAFIFFFVLSLWVMVGLQVTGAHLTNQVAPSGILPDMPLIGFGFFSLGLSLIPDHALNRSPGFLPRC